MKCYLFGASSSLSIFLKHCVYFLLFYYGAMFEHFLVLKFQAMEIVVLKRMNNKDEMCLKQRWKNAQTLQKRLCYISPRLC